ncbi:hypothetical protein E0H95_15605 [Pseudomonas syringae pv. tomato]|nr:hypothetical protein [Pseudomonas syringae pv. tomato]
MSAMGCEAALIQTTSVVPDVTYAPVYCRSPAVRGRVRSHENREIPDERSIARSAHITGFCPQGVGADLSAMGPLSFPKNASPGRLPRPPARIQSRLAYQPETPSARKRRYNVRSLSPSSLASSLREPLNTRSA